MSEFKTFEDLEAWKACRDLRLFVAKKVVPTLPSDERYRLKDQLLRCSRSTTANVAEGYGRFHFKESSKFARNARGSAFEVLDHLITGVDESLVSAELESEGRGLIETAVKLLNGYVRYLEKRAAEGTQSTNSPIN